MDFIGVNTFLEINTQDIPKNGVCYDISIIEDNIVEESELFSIVLSNTTNVNLGDISTQFILIDDDDGKIYSIHLFCLVSYIFCCRYISKL